MQIVILVGSLIAVVAVMTVVLLFVRRRFLATQRDASQQGGLLEQLRQMKLTGQMSEEEFAAAKARLGSKMRESAASSRPIFKGTRTPAAPQASPPASPPPGPPASRPPSSGPRPK